MSVLNTAVDNAGQSTLLSLPVVAGIALARWRINDNLSATIAGMNQYSLYLGFPALLLSGILASTGEVPRSLTFWLLMPCTALLFAALSRVLSPHTRGAGGALALVLLFGNTAYLGIPLAVAALGEEIPHRGIASSRDSSDDRRKCGAVATPPLVREGASQRATGRSIADWQAPTRALPDELPPSRLPSPTALLGASGWILGPPPARSPRDLLNKAATPIHCFGCARCAPSRLASTCTNNGGSSARAIPRCGRSSQLGWCLRRSWLLGSLASPNSLEFSTDQSHRSLFSWQQCQQP